MTTTTSGYEVMRSGHTVLFYVNRDGLPLSDRCNERMWKFCMEQYPQSERDNNCSFNCRWRFLDATEIERIRDQMGAYRPVMYVDPPYQVATNSRLKVHEKLQMIQNYIQRLEYNYTGMQFFDLNATRPLYGLMDTARHM